MMVLAEALALPALGRDPSVTTHTSGVSNRPSPVLVTARAAWPETASNEVRGGLVATKCR
jgi:hypothetical protein